jgi:CxxC motif-containing protein (DUF1111 family)
VASAVLLLQARQGSADARVTVQRGAALFSATFTPKQGLGPLFNKTSCVDCHNTPTLGGGGPEGLAPVLRVGRLADDGFDPLVGRGGPVARAHSVGEVFSSECTAMAGVPPSANLTSVRNSPPLFGLGEIDSIPDAAILGQAAANGGRPNFTDGRVGRFGWKADTADLQRFVADAFRNELGITSPMAAVDFVRGDGCGAPSIDVDASVIEAVTAFIRSLPSPAAEAPGNARLFEEIGCAACHVPQLAGVPLYSDLLLHDMGSALDDAVTQGQARGVDWRTTPLWGLSGRTRFLHDGRARTIEAAILAHGGEAESAAQQFRTLPAADRQALVEFLRTL